MPAVKLTNALRAQVVARFAAWKSGAEIRAWLKAEHGIEVGPPALVVYNFDNPLSRQNGTAKWIQLFDEVRAAAIAGVSAVPIAHKARRLQVANDQMERILALQAGKENVNVIHLEKIHQLLEYAAKEEGGMFTNVRVLQHNAAGALAQLLGCDESELPRPDGTADA